ncbi:hypothetical protein IE53DRAFT_383546 [Violaceomyces palustris]|uniref:Uncharacterized protein n=1 Tax=Violaceomyces palustris TaxID=1673888 RepID=A0ACD0P783_9BASI|nr:hypothetical protein IE53DRAFT_383546 [Violaceomyces palustris]
MGPANYPVDQHPNYDHGENDPQQLPSYTPQTRPPPPEGPAPAYATVLGKVYPYSLRPVILFTSFITFLYLLVVAISQLRDVGNVGNTTRLNTFNIVCGALYLAAAAAEVVGFLGALKLNLRIATLYSRISIPAFATVVASEVIDIVSHFAFKSDQISACTRQYTGAVVSNGSGWLFGSSSSSTTTFSESDAQKYCNNRWSSDSTWQIIWLIVTLVLGIPFVVFSFGFVRQLRDPRSVRVIQRNWGWGNGGGGGGNRNAGAPSSMFTGPYDPLNANQGQAYPMAPYPPYGGSNARADENDPYAHPTGGMYAPPQHPPAPSDHRYNESRAGAPPTYARGTTSFDEEDLNDVKRNSITGDSSTARDPNARGAAEEAYGYNLNYDDPSPGNRSKAHDDRAV